jgi:hypothetical protein
MTGMTICTLNVLPVAFNFFAYLHESKAFGLPKNGDISFLPPTLATSFDELFC